jgi:uncharacterized protein with HEPN domain
MKQPDDAVLLCDMRDFAGKAIPAAGSRLRCDLDSDDVFAAAMERFIEIIGEAASRVSEATRQRISGVPWYEIVGMRNRLIHGSASVDHDVMWA